MFAKQLPLDVVVMSQASRAVRLYRELLADSVLRSPTVPLSIALRQNVPISTFLRVADQPEMLHCLCVLWEERYDFFFTYLCLVRLICCTIWDFGMLQLVLAGATKCETINAATMTMAEQTHRSRLCLPIPYWYVSWRCILGVLPTSTS